MSQAIGHGFSSLSFLLPVTCKAKSRSNSKGKFKPVKVVDREEAKLQKDGGFGDKKKKDPLWQCIQGCGACCKLEKGPTFATAEEIFDTPSDIELYKSLVGADGWCINFDKSTRTCSIYDDRPYFCRAEPDVFQNLYGINKRKFNKEACRYQLIVGLSLIATSF
ncbi:unnamed protein product [Amaranthus hypochondriacus]